MKRFITFILFVVLFATLSIHNPVMAFGDSMNNMSMCDHTKGDIQEGNTLNIDIDDCESVCCFDGDFGSSNFSNLTTKNYKKKFNKVKYSFIELNFHDSFIYEWNLIGNISPPNIEIKLKKNNYSSLVGIIKSNT